MLYRGPAITSDKKVAFLLGQRGAYEGWLITPPYITTLTMVSTKILVLERSDARRTSKQLFSGSQVYLAHRYRATWVARRCRGQEMLPPKSRAERQR